MKNLFLLAALLTTPAFADASVRVNSQNLQSFKLGIECIRADVWNYGVLVLRIDVQQPGKSPKTYFYRVGGWRFPETRSDNCQGANELAHRLLYQEHISGKLTLLDRVKHDDIEMKTKLDHAYCAKPSASLNLKAANDDVQEIVCNESVVPCP